MIVCARVMTEGAHNEPKVLSILDNALEVAEKSDKPQKRNDLRVGPACEYVR